MLRSILKKPQTSDRENDICCWIYIEISCGVHITLNFNDPNRLFLKLHLVDHPYKNISQIGNV